MKVVPLTLLLGLNWPEEASSVGVSLAGSDTVGTRGDGMGLLELGSLKLVPPREELGAVHEAVQSLGTNCAGTHRSDAHASRC